MKQAQELLSIFCHIKSRLAKAQNCWKNWVEEHQESLFGVVLLLF